jgi:hypothetical protein
MGEVELSLEPVQLLGLPLLAVLEGLGDVNELC